MTNESPHHPPDTAGAGRHRVDSDPATPGAGALAVLATAWLLAMLSSARQAVGRTPGAGDLAVTQAALALPAVITASLLAGTAVGLAAVYLAGRRVPAVMSGPVPRFGVAGGAGAALGLAVATPIAFGYGGLPSILVLAGTVTAAATLGGLLAGVRFGTVVAAGVSGALGVFLVGFVLGVFDSSLLDLFGSGDTTASQVAANAWVALTASLVAGLVAGVLGYTYLRRYGGALRWPAYLVAGAMPGLLILVAEAVTRLGGAQLFRLAGAVSADDHAVLRYLNAARFNRALIVLFIGALVAIFLFGRTLRPPPAPGAGVAEPEETEPEEAAAGPESEGAAPAQRSS
jgi:hypothetical protein